MSLLEKLGLPPIKPMPVMSVTATQGAEVRNGQARAVPVQNANAVVAAKELRPLLDAREQTVRSAYDKLLAGQPRLEAALAQATGEQKATLTARKAVLEKSLRSLQGDLLAIDADRRALDNAGVDAATCNAILSRIKAPVGTAKTNEVDRHDDPLEKKPLNQKTTTTTTSYADGNATTRTSETTTKVGLDGASHGTTTTNNVVEGGNVTNSKVEKKTTLGLGGLTHEKSARVDREREVTGANGEPVTQKSGSEKKSMTTVGLGGAAHTTDTKVTGIDGTSTAKNASTGVERGDGKAGAKTVRATTTTDAGGNEQKTTTTNKAGITSDKDGIGAYGEREKAFERKGKDGLTTGAVAGLTQNVKCNVKALETTPPSYDLSISIDLGVSASLSLKKGAGEQKPDDMKEKGTKTVGAGVSGSVSVNLTRHYVLSEAEAAGYVAGLKEAAGGGGSNTKQEFAVIRLGVSKSWDAAREFYLAATGNAMSPDELAKMKAGESVETGTKKRAGGTVNAGVENIGLEGGYEVGREASTKVTKEKDGTLTYDTSQADSEKLSGAAKINVGVVEGGFGASHTNTTSNGYKISIDPKAANAAEMQKALQACKSQQDLDAFAKKYPAAVQEHTKGTGSADTTGASIGIGTGKVAVAFGHGIDDQTTYDKDGKPIKRVVTGSNEGGMTIGIGSHTIGDADKEKAVAEITDSEHATLDVGKTNTGTDMLKLYDSVTGKGPKKGAIAKATGAPADTDSSNVEKFALSNSDLQFLGGVACEKSLGRWMNACNKQHARDDWRAAGQAIRGANGSPGAVAAELAKFVGKDSVGRKEIVTLALRASGDLSRGSRSEFPEGLGKLEPEYNALVIKESETTLDALAKEPDGAKKAADKGAELLTRLETLYRPLDSAVFQQPAVKAEMLGAINNRKEKIRAKLRVLAGRQEDELTKPELVEQYNELLRVCTGYKYTETECFDKLVKFNNEVGQAIPIAKLIKQLRDLHTLWTPKYDDMASLAQQNGFGKEIYWQYKPDRERFEKAVKGAPGKAKEAKPETADKRKPTKQQVEDEAAANKGFREGMDDSIKQLREFQQKLPAARQRVLALSKQLEDLAEKNYKKQADVLFGQAKALYESAEGFRQRCKPNHVPDMMAYGAPALEDYNKAVALLSKGVALYPKAATK